MKKNFIKSIIVTILLICTMPTYSHASQSSLKDIKAKQEFIAVYDKLRNIRDNIDALSVFDEMSEENVKRLTSDLQFYISELAKVQRELDDIKRENINSKADVALSNQLHVVAESIKISLENMIIFAQAILDNKDESTKLFFSDYLENIYYYISLSDQMLDYLNRYYKLT